MTRCTFHENIEDVEVEGNLAYCLLSGEVQILDVSNPYSISTLGATTDFYGGNALCVSGNLIFTIGSTRFTIYNSTDPTNPTYVEHRWIPDSSGYDIAVSGDYVYIASTSGGLYVYNVSYPYLAPLVGTLDTISAFSVEIDGDMAFIADSNNDRIIVVDVSDVTSPKFIRQLRTTWDIGPSPFNIHVEGDYAYVAFDSDNDFAIFKIANTKSPTLEATEDSMDIANAVCVEGNYAFVADHFSKLYAIDITNPTMPTLAGSCNTPGPGYSVEVAGNYAFVACTTFGVVAINISTPSQPVLVDTCDTSGEARDLCIKGDYMYVADRDSGIQVIDISDVTSLTIVDTLNTPGAAFCIDVAGDVAFVADDQSVRVIDVTNPTSISSITSYAISGNCRGLTIEGDYLYCTNGVYGLLVLDITDPENPVFGGSVGVPGFVNHLAIQGDRVFIQSDNELAWVDINNPKIPIYLNRTTTLNGTSDIFVNGDYIYLANGYYGLKVMEVQQTLPRIFNGPGIAQSLPIFESTSETVTSATLTPIHSVSVNTSIIYSLSADNGVNWEVVTPGVEHVFTHQGKQLVWQAVLDTIDVLETPTLSNLTITYDTIMDSPVLTSPSDTTLTGNNQPTFEWDAVSGASDYLIQIDIASTFNTPSLFNVTVGDITYTPSSPLSDGVWYWRVASFDGEGILGSFSSFWTLEIESTVPAWVQIPENQDIELGSDFRYDLNVTDSSGISKWWLNDTAQFTIDSDGVITNDVSLSVGDYGIQVWVNDTLNNIQTDEFTVSVADTTAPTWDQVPTNQILECGEDFSYDLNATDLSGLGIWWLNDTVHFSVDTNGVISSIGVIPVGQYDVEVRAHDIYNNPCYGFFTVTVEDTLGPTWSTAPTDQVLEFGESLDYQLQVTDPSGIDHYECDDTVHFAIDFSGRLTNITPLAVGTYEITVTIYDPYDNELTDTFSIIVQEESTTTSSSTTDTTTSTTGDGQLMGTIFIVFIAGVAVVALIVIIFLIKSKSGGS